MSRFIDLGVGRWALTSMAVLALGACSGGDNEDLSRWMQELRARTQPKVQPIAAPVPFVPQAYRSEGAVAPFDRDKLTAALRQAAGATTPNVSLLTPELNRRKEPLEAEPLDAIVMVGVLDQKGQRVALVRVNNLLYQVRLGNHLGQNYGRITRITETDITLREIVQDGTGEWIERQAVLQLQEGTK